MNYRKKTCIAWHSETRNSLLLYYIELNPSAGQLQGLEVKPGLHERHKHKDKVNTKTKRDIFSGTCEDKTTRIFLCFVFCPAFGLCLDYDPMLSLMTI